jgi:hypothetical protein
MAVVRVTVAAGTFTFVIPQDSDFDGIPDIYEARFGAASGPGSLIRDADPDADGISAFDEYRGFIVSGKHVRTDPTQKDLFLHLVNPADSIVGVFVVSGNCGTSCLGGGTTTYPAPTTPNATLTLPATAGTLGGVGTFTTNAAVFSTAHAKGEIIAGLGRARIVTVTSSTSVTAEVTAPFAPGAVSAGAWALRESLFANVYSLVPAERVHLLGYAFGATNALTTEWVDNFVSLVPSQTLTISGPGDRTVNANRLYGSAQKGIRIMEGLNTNNPATLGWAFGTGSPNSVGNIILFTQRSVTYIAGLISDGAGASLRYSSFVNGGWSTPTLVGNGDPANDDVRNFIFSRAIQYYLAMEVAHSLDLTPTENTTQKTSYGYHYAPYTGDCVDQAITTKIKGGFNTFYIPSICGLTDQSQFMISP